MTQPTSNEWEAFDSNNKEHLKAFIKMVKKISKKKIKEMIIYVPNELIQDSLKALETRNGILNKTIDTRHQKELFYDR